MESLGNHKVAKTLKTRHLNTVSFSASILLCSFNEPNEDSKNLDIKPLSAANQLLCSNNISKNVCKVSTLRISFSTSESAEEKHPKLDYGSSYLLQDRI